MQGESGPAGEAIRFALAYESIWQSHFPQLLKKGHWEIAHALCVDLLPHQAFFSALHGRCQQELGMDDATVKEGLGEMAAAGFCTFDPTDRALGARSMVLATETLRAAYDTHLAALAALLFEAGQRLGGPPPVAIAGVTRAQRMIILRGLAAWGQAYADALERHFDAEGLSPSRRQRAQRNLTTGGSHMQLVYRVLDHALAPGEGGAEAGLLADDLAAALLLGRRQGIETTRQHIQDLMALNILERRPGRRLHVGLSDGALRELLAASADAAADLPRLALKLANTLAPPDNVAPFAPRPARRNKGGNSA